MTPAVDAARRAGIRFDESALAFDTILVSAGRRGLQLEVAPADLIRTLAATTRALAA